MAIWKGLGVQEHERKQVLRLMFHLAMSALLVSSDQVEETLVLTKLNRLYEVRLS